jgi:methyl-accepting chemotaxis protein
MDYLNKLSLKQKLLASFSLVVMFFIFVMGILFNSQFKLGAIQDDGAHRFKDSERISQISFEVASVYAVSADAVINRHLDETKKELLKANELLKISIKDVYAIADTAAEKANALTFEKDYKGYIALIENELLPELHGKADMEKLRAIDEKIDAQRELALSSLDKIYKSIHEESLESDREFDSTFKNGIMFSAIAAFAGIIFAVVLLMIISNGLTTQLRKLAASLGQSGMQVSSAAVQIASASDQLSSAANEQSASLQETSSSIEEISQMVKSNSENAKQSSQFSENSLGTAEKGKVAVELMVKVINEINESNKTIVSQIDVTNSEIENIVSIINEIGNKTKVINEIVFQTKLLSFNASVEAARAGEHGKGFAVVAEEIGSLAQMSGNAASEITSMLESSTKSVQDIVSNSKNRIGSIMKQNQNKIESGKSVANECSDILNEIVSSVANVAKMVNEISSASMEQSQGVEEITKAVSQLDQVTQQNSQSSNEAASAASALSEQAENLNNLVQMLVKTIEGQRAA